MTIEAQINNTHFVHVGSQGSYDEKRRGPPGTGYHEEYRRGQYEEEPPREKKLFDPKETRESKERRDSKEMRERQPASRSGQYRR